MRILTETEIFELESFTQLARNSGLCCLCKNSNSVDGCKLYFDILRKNRKILPFDEIFIKRKFDKTENCSKIYCNKFITSDS